MRGKGSGCLQLIFKWFSKQNKNQTCVFLCSYRQMKRDSKQTWQNAENLKVWAKGLLYYFFQFFCIFKIFQ